MHFFYKRKTINSLSSSSKKIYIKTYGCQMNVYDSQKIIDLMEPFGFGPCEEPKDADLILLNTCHIREKAEEKVFSDLGRMRPFKKARQGSGDHLILIVAGCVAQAEGARILRRAPYVDAIIGPQTYHQLPEIVGRILRKENPGNKPGYGVLATGFPKESKFDYLPEESLSSGPSAFLSIQEGCDKFCRYCVVPFTRGAEFSRSVEEILKEAQILVGKGSKEITLLGQNVNAYHGLYASNPSGDKKKNQEISSSKDTIWGLAQLLNLLKDIPGLERLRYTTSHPRDMTPDLIKAHGEIKSLMPFLHLPVQSGSDGVLEKMNRKHTVKFYKEIIQGLLAVRPEMKFSSDFIVGFPGESDEDFQETCALVEEVKFSQAYSFKYSPRDGTIGARLQQIPEEIKNKRLQYLQSIIEKHQQEFNHSCIGQKVYILVEKAGRHSGQWSGRTPHMQSVSFYSAENCLGKILEVSIDSAKGYTLQGTVTSDQPIAAA
jgi:tRNA-2-methylthio-N6-dimethylallyladenosine synthase